MGCEWYRAIYRKEIMSVYGLFSREAAHQGIDLIKNEQLRETTTEGRPCSCLMQYMISCPTDGLSEVYAGQLFFVWPGTVLLGSIVKYQFYSKRVKFHSDFIYTVLTESKLTPLEIQITFLFPASPHLCYLKVFEKHSHHMRSFAWSVNSIYAPYIEELVLRMIRYLTVLFCFSLDMKNPLKLIKPSSKRTQYID